MRLGRAFIFACLLTPLSAAGALACTCGGYPSPAESFESATAVFVGRVVRATPATVGEASYAEQTVVTHVEEAFKGTQAGTEIVLTQPAHNCAPKFETGARRLFYAGRDPKTQAWEVRGCGRGSDLEAAADDLLYLRALPLSAQRNRVSGMLRHYEDGPEKGFTLVERVAGAKVRVKAKGGQTYEAVTNGEGVYELYDLPPGEYSIEPELPFGLKVRFPMQFGPGGAGRDGAVNISLGEKTSAGADFVLVSDNVIAGRVLGPGGAPLPNVCVDLVSASKGSVHPAERIFDCTDAEGRYRLEGAPPGSYLIAANQDGRLSGSEPFPVVFHPGTFERGKAAVVTVGRGDSRAGLDVAVPALLPTVTVSGVLLYSDGRPVAREAVFFNADSEGPRHEGLTTALTDEAGRFSLTVIRGLPGKVHAEMFVYEGKYEKPCPALRKFIEDGADKPGGLAVRTRAVAFDAGRDAGDVRLAFAFPYCPLRKEAND